MEESLGSIILNRLVGPALRTSLAGLGVLLAKHGWVFDATVWDDLVKAALPLLAVFALSVWQKVQAAKLVQRALEASPGTPLATVKARVGGVPSALHLFSLLLALSVVSSGCGGLTPPPNVGAEGTVAWYGIQVSKGVSVIREAAISGESAGIFKRNDTVTIIEACKVADTTTGELASALAAGAGASGAKAKALAAIRAVMADLPGKLSPAAAERIAPFILSLQALLGVIERLPFFDPAPTALLSTFAPVLA